MAAILTFELPVNDSYLRYYQVLKHTNSVKFPDIPRNSKEELPELPVSLSPQKLGCERRKNRRSGGGVQAHTLTQAHTYATYMSRHTYITHHSTSHYIYSSILKESNSSKYTSAYSSNLFLQIKQATLFCYSDSSEQSRYSLSTF